MSGLPADSLDRLHKAEAVSYPYGGTCAKCGRIHGDVWIYACRSWVVVGRSGLVTRRTSYLCGDCAERWIEGQRAKGKEVAWYGDPVAELEAIQAGRDPFTGGPLPAALRRDGATP